MFKKTITITMLCILSITSIWAVWEGNASAGSAEEFPSGLFASSDLFPTHTLIEIVNLEQNTKSRAVIVGNTGADGVLIKLSPDLAAALAVRQGITVRVRISIPPLVAEEGADPVLLTKNSAPKQAPIPIKEAVTDNQETAVLSAQATAAEDSKQSPVEKSASNPAPTETSIAIAPESESAEEAAAPQEVPPVIEPVQEHVAAAIPFEVAEPQKAETVVPEEAPQPIAEVQEPTPPAVEYSAQPEAIAEAAEPVEPIFEGEKEAQQQLVAIRPIQESSIEDSAAYTNPVANVPEIETTQYQDEDSEQDAAVPEVAIPTEPVVSPQSEPAVAEAASPEHPPVDDEPPLYDTDDGIPEKLYLADEDGEAAEPASEVLPIEQPDDPITDETVAKLAPIEEADDSSVAEAVPIEAEEEVPEAIAEVSPIEAEEPLPVVEEPAPLAAVEPEPAAPTENIAEVSLAAVPVEQHLMLVPAEPRAPRQEDVPPLPSTKAKHPAAPQNEASMTKTEKSPVRPAEDLFVTDGLKKDAFYVQIARFTDMLNVQSFVQRYGKQYPISVEKNGTGTGSFYKVYVGPLQKDERGAALETFQRLGFKDAFLKKAP
ncbi:SPOR domain-containing protein [Treponema sp.]|uniref:SPOR domain-containing protein n=1 Tax=Treponema sp. TaxID=166 RepID=UPI003FA1C3F2